MLSKVQAWTIIAVTSLIVFQNDLKLTPTIETELTRKFVRLLPCCQKKVHLGQHVFDVHQQHSSFLKHLLPFGRSF